VLIERLFYYVYRNPGKAKNDGVPFDRINLAISAFIFTMQINNLANVIPLYIRSVLYILLFDKYCKLMYNFSSRLAT